MGKDVYPHDTPVSCADRAGRGDEFRLAQGQHLAPHQPRQPRPIEETNHQHEGEDAGFQNGGQCDHEDKGRKHHDQLCKTHEQIVRTSPDVAAQPTDYDTYDRGEGYGDDAHRHGHSCAIDDAGKYISPNLIRTEDVPAIRGGIDFA